VKLPSAPETTSRCPPGSRKSQAIRSSISACRRSGTSRTRTPATPSSVPRSTTRPRRSTGRSSRNTAGGAFPPSRRTRRTPGAQPSARTPRRTWSPSAGRSRRNRPSSPVGTTVSFGGVRQVGGSTPARRQARTRTRASGIGADSPSTSPSAAVAAVVNARIQQAVSSRTVSPSVRFRPSFPSVTLLGRAASGGPRLRSIGNRLGVRPLGGSGLRPVDGRALSSSP
jgi:hypothetical protein